MLLWRWILWDGKTLSSSWAMPSQARPSLMGEIASGVDRLRSVSSIRKRYTPPLWRAKSQLKSAVRAPPICRNPVGEGAKRVTTVMEHQFFLSHADLARATMPTHYMICHS